MTEFLIDSQLCVRTVLDQVERLVRDQVKTGKVYLILSSEPPKKRTDKQNRSLHQYCEILAEKLNESGLDMRAVIKQNVDIPWSKHSAKEFLWKPIQKVITGKESTTQPTTEQYKEIYETLNRHLCAKFGIYVEWPSLESLINQSRVQNG